MTEQLVLDLARAEPPTFANFVAGANREAVAALAALATGTSCETGILLWGAPGAGKSHLLRATALAADIALRPVIYCATPEDLPSATPGELPSVDETPPTLFVVDAIDRATEREQARLFTQVNRLAAMGDQWLAAAAVPPARLALREDLRTRLALGLVLEIVPLADDDKPAALVVYARERGFRLSDDVIVYLLAHGRRDMTSLVATLAALDRHSLATQRSITVPLLREWLQRDLGLSR
jgi:DnaA family protein